MGLSYLLDAFIFLGFSPFAPNYMFHDVFKLSVSIVIWNYWVCSSERRPQRVEQFFYTTFPRPERNLLTIRF